MNFFDRMKIAHFLIYLTGAATKYCLIVKLWKRQTSAFLVGKRHRRSESCDRTRAEIALGNQFSVLKDENMLGFHVVQKRGYLLLLTELFPIEDSSKIFLRLIETIADFLI